MWFKSSKEFMIDFNNAFNRRSYKQAAFLLHQATERFYTTVLLVFTGYKAKRHNIETIGRHVSGCDAAFLKVFPRATKEQVTYSTPRATHKKPLKKQTERAGFEPAVPVKGTPVFETGSLSRSDTSP